MNKLVVALAVVATVALVIIAAVLAVPFVEKRNAESRRPCYERFHPYRDAVAYQQCLDKHPDDPAHDMPGPSAP